MANKITTLEDRNDEVVIPIGVGKANTKAEWFTVKLNKAADDTEVEYTTRNGGKYTFHCVNGGTGWFINSSNRKINIFRVRTEFRAAGGNALGVHEVKPNSTVWTRVYGDWKEGVGKQNKREGYYTVEAGGFSTALVIGDDGNRLAGRLGYTMMRERANGGWRCFCDLGTGYHVNWASLDLELTARNNDVGPCLYMRGVNNSNIFESYTIIDVLEEL